MNQRIISIDSQILNTIQSCARKTQLTFIENLTLPKKAEPLEKGDLLHFMLENYYIDLMSGVKDIDGIVELGQSYAVNMDLPVEEVQDVIYQFREYCKHYSNDQWKPLAVEEVGSKILYESEAFKIVYNFKVDLIATHPSIDKPVPWDHKSSKRRQDPSSLSNQFMGYAWGLGSSYVLVNKIGFQKTLSCSERFQRETLNYSPDRLTEWQDNTIFWVRMLQLHIDSNNFPMNLTSCDKYGGCIFEGICSRDREARQWIKERDYKVTEKWDVAQILEVSV